MYEAVEHLFHGFVEYCGVALELTGVLIILGAAIKAIYHMIRHTHTSKPDLDQGISLALEFILGAEVLHTIMVQEPKELIVIGVIMVLRAAITLLLHWEAKQEEAHEKK